LREENGAAWQKLWRGRILLHGADTRWQALADAAFFYLNSSVHPSSPASTSIFGLAQWHDYHYYYGHIMWDLEVFALPPLILLQPDAARSLLDYRFSRRLAARRNAKLYGRRGLQFPWESSMSTGEESTPGAGKGAWHEDHVTLDVAHAFSQYARATGDRLFLREQAWPILEGATEWLASRLTRTRRGYELCQTVGIAETGQPVDNDAFTLMASRVVVQDVLRCAGDLGMPVPPDWADIGERLTLPVRGKVIQSHDRFRPSEPKGATPGPLAGLFPFWYPAEPEVVRATLEFYLGLADQYIGSPMLSAMYGVWAAWLGHRREALELFDAGYAQFVEDRFLQTYEYRPDKWPEQPKAGPFFANLGGFLTGLVYGLPGLHIHGDDPNSWPSRPVVLPETWDAIEVKQLWVRGQPARLLAAHGADRARIEFAS
jgi:trehalose/maltose hydrolase-like predicted phosphorylase